MSRGRKPSRALLTIREREVLEQIADGFGTSEIARNLAITPRGVVEHIRHLTRKLQARNRAHAVSLAYRKGVLKPIRRVADSGDGDPPRPKRTAA